MEYIDPVIALHDIARQIEREYGRKDLALDIRRCADRVNELEAYCEAETARRLTEVGEDL